MINIIDAVVNISNREVFEIGTFYEGKNRANTMGDALEEYAKDMFANTFDVDDIQERNDIHEQEFSWLGNQNNPPDMMIRGGEAIEVKKTISPRAGLALNSSYPKCSVLSTSSLITEDFRNCEDWKERDIIYLIGHVDKTSVKSIWMVYGSIYAAKHQTYERIKTTISEGINEIPNVEFAETNELGGVKKVDPLGITNLRIRGMWSIQNPRRVFEHLHTPTNATFELIAIIPSDKYNSFPEESISEASKIEQIEISDVKVKDPNNPANQIDCKLIKYIYP